MAILYFLAVWLAACVAGGIVFWAICSVWRRLKQSTQRDEFSFQRDPNEIVNEVPEIDLARLAWRKRAAMAGNARGAHSGD
jgi:hypothetical protein